MFSSDRRFVGLALFLLIVGSSLARAEHACVWKVSGPKGGTLYLGGSMHALRGTDYPLPAAYNRAFDASDRLVFETEPGAFPKLEKRRDKVGLYPSGDSLKNHIDPRTYDYLRRFFARLGTPEAEFTKFRPWYLALQMRLPGKSGLSSSLGVDSYLGSRARANRKAISGLESAREHLDVFSGLSDRQGEAILLVELIKSQEGPQLDGMVAQWRHGEVDAIERDSKKSLADFPAFAERIIDQRNRNWMPKIERALASHHTYFVVVGAAHLGGPNGLLALLRARGYRVEPL